jgi:indolepyruvate ferredoxin oxidoreductase beta subunit
MSQRGGSVVTYVRYGDKVYSPVIEKGEADIIIAFEQLEAARWLSFLKPGGILITSTQKIDPMPVVMGTAGYPEDILAEIRAKGVRVIAVDARIRWRTWRGGWLRRQFDPGGQFLWSP